MKRQLLLKILRGYYYLAPLWLVLESTVLPGLRTGIVTDSTAGRVGFYGMEAAIGAAFWFKIPLANIAAIVENALYFAAGAKWIIFEPMDMAMAAIDAPNSYEARGASYVAMLPGVIVSCTQVVARLYDLLYGKPES